MKPSAKSIKATAADWTARRDAGLSQTEVDELQRWLDTDARHREAFAQCDSAWGALDRPYHAGAADDLLRAVQVSVRRRRRQRVLSAVATVAVLIAAGAIWRSMQPSAGDSLATPPAGMAKVIVPARQNLPDGSLVELNVGAELEADFTAQRRRVVLQKGEAHFHVTKDPARPFVVVVDNVEVRAVGTSFSVQRGATNVEVLVTSGEVALDKHEPAAAAAMSSSRNPAPQTLATLAPGYRAVVELAASVQTPPHIEILETADVRERLAWRAPQLEFSGTPLAEAVALLNEQAVKAEAAGQPAQRYLIGDAELGGIRVSGLFRVDNTASFVRLLKHGFGIESESRGDTGEIVLRKARE